MKELFKRFYNYWLRPQCYKQSLGYNCRHEMHGNVKECGGE